MLQVVTHLWGRNQISGSQQCLLCKKLNRAIAEHVTRNQGKYRSMENSVTCLRIV